MDGENHRLEIVSQNFTDFLSNQGEKNLVSLGWNLPNEEENLNKYFSLEEIINGTASKLIVASFKLYDLDSGDDKKAKYKFHDPNGLETGKSNPNFSFNEIEDILNSDTKEISEKNKGRRSLILHLKAENGTVQRIRATKLGVSASNKFVLELRNLFGDKHVWIS